MRTGGGRCAFLNRATNDGRIIRKLTFREAPLPLTMIDPEREHFGAVLVGKVVLMEQFASTNEVFAYAEVTEDWAIPFLQDTQHYMEIDLDLVTYDEVVLNGVTTMDITSGRLSSIHLGTKPCWPHLEFRLNS